MYICKIYPSILLSVHTREAHRCLRWGAAVPSWCWGLHRGGPSHDTWLQWTVVSLPSPVTLNYTFLEGKNTPDVGFVMPVWQPWSHRKQSHVPTGPWCPFLLWKVTFWTLGTSETAWLSFFHCLPWEGRLKKHKMIYINIFKNLKKKTFF